jgi:hypothetical protein
LCTSVGYFNHKFVVRENDNVYTRRRLSQEGRRVRYTDKRNVVGVLVIFIFITSTKAAPYMIYTVYIQTVQNRHNNKV